MNPIHHAARSGNLEEVQRLVQQDRGVVHQLGGCSGGFFTALHYACLNGHVEVAACLIDHGASVDQSTRFQRSRTALFMASRDGCVGLVRLLLERGADPSTADNDGVTPLMIACCCGHVGVVRCLLECSPSINSRCIGGKTALWFACSTRQGEVTRVLLEAGADPTLGSDQGTLPMDMARHAKNQDCARYLQVKEKGDPSSDMIRWGGLDWKKKTTVVCDGCCVCWLGSFQEWERPYILTKARWLSDATHSHTFTTTMTTFTRPTLPYLQGRVEREETLPKVELRVTSGEGGGEEGDDDDVVGAVLEYVVCHMKEELFVDLMEVMGKTAGCREGKE